MAENFLFDFVGAIADKLSTLASQEIASCFGVANEISNLKETISTIQSVLLDAEDLQLGDDSVKAWLGELKEAFYDADDLLDDLCVEAQRRRLMSPASLIIEEVCLVFSCSNSLVNGVKLGRKIRAIREKLDNVAARRTEFNLMERLTETPFLSKERREEIGSFVREEMVFGREGDKMEIINCLLRDDSVEDENVSVVPIVGIGGLGKTTLVQLVYSDELVERHFDLKMWVHVSDVFDVKVIAERVIVSATGRKLEDVGLNQLQAHLWKHFDGMRFLLVLDDVRDEDLEKWHNLRRLFVFGARGSKIIVTTRSMVVANIAGTLPPYHLRGLSMVESWSFFKKIVFSGQELESPYLIKMGKEIVKKCAGVPLAIKTIGSLLFFKRTAAEWLPVVESLFPRIPQQEFDILPILKLSFNHLPSHLKHCFAYCSLFPNGYEIDVQGLIQIWIAHGLIRSSYSSESLEDIGLGYFKDLEWRSFFQEVAKDRLGNVVRCKMHHLIRDLAISVAGNEATISHPNIIFIDEKTRHLSFDFDTDGDFSWQIPTSLFKATRLRTFLSLSKLSPLVFQSRLRVELDEGQLDAIFCHLKHLLVLDLHDFKIGTIPCSISKLMHLRYLDLSYNERMERLPNCITKLRNLEVLNLSHCDELKELPKYIKNLVNLRHLKFEGCWNLTHMPCGLGQLTSLHTLTWFIVPNDESVFTGIGGLNELSSLNNLRGKIDIRNLGYVNGDVSAFKGANLKGKQHLQSLSLYWGRDAGKSSVNPSHDEESLQSLQPHPNLKEFYVYDYAGVKFPTMFSSLANLISIWIQDCKRCKYLPQLDQISSLTSLVIRGLVALEYIEFEGVNCNSGRSTFFPSLKTLWLSNCPNLKGWWKKGDSNADYTMTAKFLQFPRLSSLHVQECPKMTWMPLFPSLDEWLWLEDASIEPLQETMKVNMIYGESATVFPPLSKLKKLCIERIVDLELIPEKWLQNLTSLQELMIYDCPMLTSLSHDKHQFTSLRLLDIRGCPLLNEIYGDNSREDWPCIVHIPNILIDNQKIQWEGCYLLDDDDSSIDGAEIDIL